MRRRDHLLVFAFVLPAPATNTGVLPAGPPPGQAVLTRPTLAQPSTHEGERTLGRSCTVHAETHTARCPTSSHRFDP
ncbi:hypothetical protein F511_46548 [Dorcoceras hygrometricum]|uniref:Secreted protein n=1 Tax=Dorcoceras hygrometricum TaxID=472368 RepID=A0A2Z6ZTA6_9LAMI|nr:hypothetical protein F511_46548 [Dorcoceras hygrometricum]